MSERSQAKTPGAVKGDEGDRYIFKLTEDEDVIFLAVKDMSHGIIGRPVDGTTGAHYDPGFEEKR